MSWRVHWHRLQRRLFWAGTRLAQLAIALGVIGVAAVVVLGGIPGLDAGDAAGGDQPADLTQTGSEDSTVQTSVRYGHPNESEVEVKALNQMNNFRESENKRALVRSAALDEIAQQHSNRMAERDFYAHDVPGGPTARERLSTVCRGGSENIHRGPLRSEVFVYGTSDTVNTYTQDGMAEFIARGWINSEGHRKNVLGSFSRVGIGVAVDDGDFYATANFC